MRKDYNYLYRSLIILIATSVLALVALAYFGTTTKNINYRVHFYDNDQLITTITKYGDSKISHNDLKKVHEQLGSSIIGYDYQWSLDKDGLFFVDFDSITQDTNVYIHKTLKEYLVEFIKPDNVEIVDVEKDNFKHGTNYLFKVINNTPNIDTKLIVLVNEQLLLPNDEGIYTIENISGDLNIEIKEILIDEFEITNQHHIYDGTIKEIKVLNNLDNIQIKYYQDEQLSKEVEPINAGIYYVSIKYTGIDYYIKDVVTTLEIEKAIPTVEINNIEVTYDGNKHSLTIDDVITNSDGKIRISKNGGKYPGVYEADIYIDETANYQAIHEKGYVTINKLTPVIVEIPDFKYIFEDSNLNTIDLSKIQTNIDGRFEFVNKDESPIGGLHEYEVKFIPKDSSMYQEYIFTIEILTITDEMALEIVKNESIEILDNYKDVNIKDVLYLPTSIIGYETPIYWYSNSTIIGIGSDGKVNILDVEGIFDVELYAIIQLGKTVEYRTLRYQIINEAENQTIIEEQSLSVEETEICETIITSSDVDQSIEEVYVEKAVLENDLIETLDAKTLRNKEDSKEESSKEIQTIKQTHSFEYHEKTIRSQVISEVILWKILSSEPIDDISNVKCNTDYQYCISGRKLQRYHFLSINNNNLKN